MISKKINFQKLNFKESFIHMRVLLHSLIKF